MAVARICRALARHSAAAVLVLLACACSIYDGSLLSTGDGASTGGSAGSPGSAGINGASGGKAGAPATGGVGATTTAGSASDGGDPTGGTVSPSAGVGATAGATVGTPMGGAGDGSAGDGGAPSEPDTCPNDANKVSPGKCGCGVPDVDTPTLAGCQKLVSKLLHRYDFEGSGTTVKDRVGTADGALKGGSLSKLDGRGVALLGGGTAGAYVDLPNRLLSSLTNATLESWVTWGGGGAWQRVFDFGDSTNASPENNPALGNTYLMFTPQSGAGFATAGFSLLGNSAGQEQDVSATVALSTSTTQVVVVAGATEGKLRLYIDGKKVGEAAWTGPLSAINDVNAWLGRSQYNNDPELSGVFHEFRMYGAALSDAEIATSFVAGPDPAFLAY
jgi:hypothetical protein